MAEAIRRADEGDEAVAGIGPMRSAGEPADRPVFGG